MVTGDKKWVAYDNVKWKRSWSMRGVCWDSQRIIYYELFPYRQTLTSGLFWQQLEYQKVEAANCGQ